MSFLSRGQPIWSYGTFYDRFFDLSKKTSFSDSISAVVFY